MLFPCSLMPELGWSAFKLSAIQQHSFHSHAHRMESLHTKTCHMKCKQRYMCRCLCVCVCDCLWCGIASRCQRGSRLYTDSGNVKQMKSLICMNHSVHLLFSSYPKNDFVQHFCFWRLIRLSFFFPQFVSVIPEIDQYNETFLITLS